MAELEDELQELEDDGEAVDYEDYDLEEEEDEEELQLGPGARLGALAHALAGRCETGVLHRGCAGCPVFRSALTGVQGAPVRWRGALAVVYLRRLLLAVSWM